MYSTSVTDSILVSCPANLGRHMKKSSILWLSATALVSSLPQFAAAFAERPSAYAQNPERSLPAILPIR